MTKARDIASAIPAPSTVSSAELGYLDGVTSAIQTQVDGKTAKATLTTTGDIYYASAANTPARLAIGSTSNVLTVAGGIPSWAAPASGGFVGCKATKTADQTLSNNTPTMLSWNDEDFDTNAFHDNSTNNTRITIPSGKAGYYLVTSYMGMFPAGAPSGNFYLAFYINGVQKRVSTNHMGSDNSAQNVEIYNLSVGDYLEAEGYQNSGGSGTVRGGAANESSFAVQYLGA